MPVESTVTYFPSNTHEFPPLALPSDKTVGALFENVSKLYAHDNARVDSPPFPGTLVISLAFRVLDRPLVFDIESGTPNDDGHIRGVRMVKWPDRVDGLGYERTLNLTQKPVSFVSRMQLTHPINWSDVHFVMHGIYHSAEVSYKETNNMYEFPPEGPALPEHPEPATTKRSTLITLFSKYGFSRE